MSNFAKIIQQAKTIIIKKENYPAQETGFFPHIYKFQNGNKKIVFFAANHSPVSREEQFEKIAKAFDELNPQIVFVENMEQFNKTSEIKTDFEKKIKDPDSWKEMLKRNGENVFAYKLAFDKTIPIISPEYNRQETAAMFQQQGYTKDQIFLFYTVTNIATYFYQSRIDPLTNYFESHFAIVAKDLNWGEYDFSLEHSKQLAKDAFGDDINFETGKGFKEKCNPISPEQGSSQVWYFTNDMARLLSNKRDEKIFEEIAKQIEFYNKIFIVYGGSHGVALEPAIQYLIQNI